MGRRIERTFESVVRTASGGGQVMIKPAEAVQRATTTNVGQLIRALEAYPPELPVEVGLGYRDETETYREVTVTTINASWLGSEPGATVVLLIGETGTLRVA
jgi:hypothetical protein